MTLKSLVTSRAELVETVQSTAVMDWPSWGPSPNVACEELATGIAIVWPALADAARDLLQQVTSGQVPPLDGFGLLQDLVP